MVSKSKPLPGDEPKQTTFPACAEDTNDSVRLKCRELLTAALKTERKLDVRVQEGADPKFLVGGINPPRGQDNIDCFIAEKGRNIASPAER